jgi:hypothetical protein
MLAFVATTLYLSLTMKGGTLKEKVLVKERIIPDARD